MLLGAEIVSAYSAPTTGCEAYVSVSGTEHRQRVP